MQNLCLYHITFIHGSHFATTSGALSLADCYKIERQRSFRREHVACLWSDTFNDFSTTLYGVMAGITMFFNLIRQRTMV